MSQASDSLPTTQAAAIIGVSKWTLTRWHRLGVKDLPQPARLSAQCLRWSRSALLAWLESRRTQAGSPAA